MPARPVLVDSSFYIGRMRAGRDPFHEMREWGTDREFAICGVVRCEVARGIINPKLLAVFRKAWSVMLNVPTDNRIWNDVEDLAWKLARSGKHPPLSDLVIACCALRIEAVVLTLDAHFRDVPNLMVTDHLL
ncbi:MAG: PIN domain-containing protein [Terrimicrobiaceae bacterium]|nr:PIN domain-containing protein [Terrimicrobiaceae bacterium]